MEKYSASITLKGFMFAWILRLQRLTWRVCFQGREHLDRLYGSENKFLLCFWHGKYMPIFPLLEGYEAYVLSNLSKRGAVIAEICRNFDYHVAQIPNESKGGTLQIMEALLSGARAVGIAVDGPLGPQHRVKNNVIRMASTLGFDILPGSVGSRRKFVLNRRWDRMEFPLPFTKVCLVFGEPVKVPSKLSDRQVQELAGQLAEAIAGLDAKAENIVFGRGE
jgi:lysophospholipid acyltransferase (LPLAT)-like uncharacterized protein